MNRVNQLPEVINMDDETHIEHHEIIHEALRGYDVEIASKANAEHTHQWAEIESTPEAYPPSSHKHSASDINSGTLGIARIPVGTASGTVAAGNDSRLTDARTPKAHSHQISEVTNLRSELDSKSNTGHTHDWATVEGKPATFPPGTHTHSISEITNLQTTLNSKSNSNHAHSTADVTSGTFNIARIPVGTASGTVASGNDPRFTDSRTPKAHTHGISDVTDLGQRLDVKADLVDGKVPTSQIPAIALTKPSSVTSRAAMTALDAQEGDVAIISTGADKGSYILGDGPSTSFDSWLLLAVESNVPVQSVNGQTGTILLSPSDIGAAPESHSHTIAQITNLQTTLNQKSNTDHTHSISNITGLEVALNGKAPSSHNHTTAQITGLDAALAGKSNTGHTHTIAEVTSLQATLDGKAASSHTHAWSTITSKPTTFAPSAHKHPVTDVTATGTASASTYLRGDGSWATPPNTATWAEVSGKPATFPPESHTHTTAQVTGLDTALAGKANSTHSHTVAQVTGLQTALDSKVATSDSRLTNARTPTAHSHAIGDITNLQSTLDTISGVAPTWTSITGKPSEFTPSSHTHAISEVTNLQSTLNSKADLVNNQIPTSQIPAIALTKPFPVTTRAQMLALTAQEGDIAIITSGSDKGTYVLGTGASSTFASWIPLASSVEVPVQSVNGQTGTIVLGVSDIGAAPASHTHTIANVTNVQTTLDGKAASSHTHTIANITNLQTTLDGKAASSHTHTIANITGLQTELDGKAASSHSHSWGQVTGKPSTFAPSTHTHTASDISHATTVGQSVMKASSAATARSAIGAGTSNLSIGTSASTAKAGNYHPTWSQVTAKPTTFAPTIGSTATTAVAGNDARLTNARTPTAHTHDGADITGELTAAVDASAASIEYESPVSGLISTTRVDQIPYRVFVEVASILEPALDTKSDVGHTHTPGSLGAVAASGATTTLWSGSQSAYDALPEATRNAIGFVAVII